MNNVTRVVFTALLLVGCNNNPPPEANARPNESAISTVNLDSTDSQKQSVDKPTIFVHKDGFPTGNETPEGAASDLMRAFINRDAELFHQRRWVVSCEGYNDPRDAYNYFLAHTPALLTPETSEEGSASPDSQRIGIVYAARASTKFSTENAALSKMFDNMGHEAFVDVVTIGESGTRYLNRVSVSQRTDKKWYAAFASVHDHETESSTEFSENYTLRKQAG